MFKFKLGSVAKSIITGFKGTITGRSHNHEGCDRYVLQPEIGEDGKVPESMFYDDVELEILDETNALPHLDTSFKYNMLDEAKCNITGFKGTITGFVEHYNGCRYAYVQPKSKENKVEDGAWVNLADLKITKAFKPKPEPKPRASRPPGGFPSSIK